jgi:hypothetical protein
VLCCRCFEPILYLSYTTACACSALSYPVLHYIIPGVEDAQQQHNFRFSKDFLFFVMDVIRRCRTPCTIHNTRHPRSTYTEGEGGLVEIICYGMVAHHITLHHVTSLRWCWQSCDVIRWMAVLPCLCPCSFLITVVYQVSDRSRTSVSALLRTYMSALLSLSSILADTMVGQVSHCPSPVTVR